MRDKRVGEKRTEEHGKKPAHKNVNRNVHYKPPSQWWIEESWRPDEGRKKKKKKRKN